MSRFRIREAQLWIHDFEIYRRCEGQLRCLTQDIPITIIHNNTIQINISQTNFIFATPEMVQNNNDFRSFLSSDHTDFLCQTTSFL